MSRLNRFAPVRPMLMLWPLLMLWPVLGWAQTAQESARGVGVVTTLAGRATVARAALAEPQPLRFKDDVFVRDRIATAEKSIVRVLLGGKALVTVRELSALTITEEAGRATVDLRSGKIAMGVVRRRMRPGEVIEIRTPNAIAAIRGTVLVVELIPEPGSGSGGAPRYTTKVHVLHGLVEVSDPNNPGAPAAQVGARESWSRTGSDPFSMAPLTPGAAEQVFADLRSAPQIAEGPSEFMASVTTREQANAVAVAEFLAPDVTGAGGGDSGGAAAPSSAPGTGTSTVTTAPVSPDLSTAASGGPGGSSGSPTGQARFGYDGQTVTVGGSLYSLTGSQTDAPAVPILEATNTSLSVGQNLMEVTGNSTFASTGSTPLLYLDSATLSADRVLSLGDGARFTLVSSLLQDRSGRLDLTSDILSLSVAASLAGSGAGPLVDLIGSSAATAGSLLAVGGSAVLDLLSASAPLLSLTQSAALTTQRSLVDLSGAAAVRLAQVTALTASSLSIRGHGVSLSGNASLTVTGDLFRIAGGSTLTVTNGALLSLSGASVLNVSGALINFVGTGNTLSISNTLCGNGGCTMIGVLPVLVTGAGSISLSNPILNLTGNNTLTIAPGSAVITVSGSAQVRQGQ
jgi:hypothetical protein